jgi:hypothetical protein
MGLFADLGVIASKFEHGQVVYLERELNRAARRLYIL